MEGRADRLNGTFGPTPVRASDQFILRRVLYGFIAVTAFFSNLLLCIVLIKRRQMLKKPYNILILNLAVTDMLTGIFVALGPRLVILQRSFPDPHGIWGEFFCRTLYNHFFILVFGKASNLTLMCLSIERWFAFVRPIQYKIAFTRPRMLKYLAVIWVFSIAGKAYSLFEQKVFQGHCVKNLNLTQTNSQLLAITHVLVTFGLPVAVTWGTFAHLWQRLKTSVAAGITNQGKARVRLLRMCALAALFLTLCWLPSECVFILIHFEMLKRHGYWKWVTFMLGAFNSCLNPWVYYFSNQEYKREFVRVLCFRRENDEAKPAVSSRARVPQGCTPSTSTVSITLSVPKTGDQLRNPNMEKTTRL